MRKILYKAKQRSSNEWVYGFYWKVGYLVDYIKPITKEGVAMGGECAIDLVTLSQYVKDDIKGNKVFENDIVECEYDEGQKTKGVIQWVDYSGCYVIKRLKNGELLSIFNHPEMEIVGNIFDNPELLEDNNG